MLSFFFFSFFNKRWDLKRETIQSSVDHFPSCQHALKSLSAGKDTTLKHVVLSPLLLAVFLLCILVHMCNHSLLLLFFAFRDVYTSDVECRDCVESMPDIFHLALCLCLCPVYV